MTKEQKIRTLKAMGADELWNAYKYYVDHFNPFDDDTCESYELTVNEIKKRLNDASEERG